MSERHTKSDPSFRKDEPEKEDTTLPASLQIIPQALEEGGKRVVDLDKYQLATSIHIEKESDPVRFETSTWPKVPRARPEESSTSSGSPLTLSDNVTQERPSTSRLAVLGTGTNISSLEVSSEIFADYESSPSSADINLSKLDAQEHVSVSQQSTPDKMLQIPASVPPFTGETQSLPNYKWQKSSSSSSTSRKPSPTKRESKSYAEMPEESESTVEHLRTAGITEMRSHGAAPDMPDILEEAIEHTATMAMADIPSPTQPVEETHDVVVEVAEKPHGRGIREILSPAKRKRQATPEKDDKPEQPSPSTSRQKQGETPKKGPLSRIKDKLFKKKK